jgi:hypothetical protein
MRLIKGKISPTKSPIAGISIVSCVPIEVALSAQKILPAADGEAFQGIGDRDEQRIELEPPTAT